ncbi:MAG TPA: hypothetical protein VFB27_01325 [Opitutaceae bacterium]|nr:hypothetical protein [Opitutaceae bacterium]
MDCRSRKGQYTLCGYSEFTSPSSPPKKYRTLTLSGSIVGLSCASLGCASGCCTETDTYSGQCKYDKNTCVLTSNGLITIVGCSNDGTIPTCDLSRIAASIGDYIVCTQASCQVDNDLVGVCQDFPVSGRSSKRIATSAQKNLSEEDTEQDAINRINAPWGDWYPVTPGGSCCAGIQPRTGFTGGFSEAQYRVHVTGTPGMLVSVNLFFTRRVYGVGAFQPYMTIPRTVQINLDGKGLIDVTDVPNDYGYETCLESCKSGPFSAFA